MQRRWGSAAMAWMALVAALVGCTESVVPARVAQVTVTGAEDTVEVGSTIDLQATATDVAGRALVGATFAWSSSDQAVATVDATGRVTGRAAGAATIRATLAGAVGSREITVVPARVATVVLTPDTATLVEGETRALSVALLDASGATLEGRTVSWSSSDESVAGVSADGTVSARSAGVAEIVAASGERADTARITVVAPPIPELRLEEAASGFFPAPTALASPPGDDRLFIGTVDGQIWITRGGTRLSRHFLDLRDRVRWDEGTERGLYSVVFHPRYAQNGYLYVSYVDLGGSMRVERYSVSGDPDVGDPSSAKPILSVPHPPTPQHYGGAMQFGPDGMLYVGTGDGGAGHAGNAQDPASLLGKLLRIDVDAGDPYAIPPGNPFVGVAGARAEIWALGLRNPWRFSFDRETGLLYLADVGEQHWEEVNVVSVGEGVLNFGWPRAEGSHCFPNGSSCSQAGLVPPVLEFPHAVNAGDSAHPAGCSVTGGFVYRGSQIPGLRGHYFYGDLCQGWVRSFRYRNGQPSEQRQWDFGNLPFLVTFGEDAAGELYALPYSGTVYRIVAAGGE